MAYHSRRRNNHIHISKLSLLEVALVLGMLVPCCLMAQSSRIEQIMSRMSLEEKIAQLLIVRVSSTGTSAESQKMIDNIQLYQPGGVCFFKGGPVREAALTNRMQAVSKVPMFISIDGEWGPSMRLDSCVEFPRQMTLGALSPYNDSLIYRMGLEVAKQCLAVGVNLNFAPCVDVNNNPQNPVINSRSFGESREKVTAKAALYMHGMQDGGIVTCIKHFPGHGDTQTDSHLGLPSIKKNRIELDELELYPYRELLRENPDMVMVGHLNIPALDTNQNSVSSLSFPIVSDLLKREMGYSGMIITDGMEMQGVQKNNRFDGDVEIQALLAGVDILLLPGKTEDVVRAIKTAVDSGLVPIELIEERCLRILEFKESKGILDTKPVDLRSVATLMNTKESQSVNDAIEQKSITLLKNDHQVLPLKRIATVDSAKSNRTVLLCVGRPQYQDQYKSLVQAYNMDYIYQPKTFSDKKSQHDAQKLMDTLSGYQRVVIAYGGANQLPAQQYGVDRRILNVLNNVATTTPTVLIHMGNPYVLDYFDSTASYEAIILSYQPTPNSFHAALKACFGEQTCEGALPISTREYACGTNADKDSQLEDFSTLSEATNAALEKMLQGGVHDKVYPGCVVVAMKSGEPVYCKAFGYYTYDHQNKVTTQTMYDVASITKTAATTLAVMKLYDEGKIKLQDQIGRYLPYLKGTNKEGISLAELLTHTSGLPAFIPFYTKIQNDERYLRQYKTPNFDVQVADNLYLRNDYLDTIRYKVAHCNLGKREYVYSDLNFLLLKEMVEKVSGMPMDELLNQSFYAPMHLTHTCFNPMRHGFSKSEIAPTEKDAKFRKQVVQGYVHDQTAALFDGNAGNAGLFTTARELASLYQMLLQGGTYQGERYLSEETVKLFTSAYEMHGCRVRGLGFHTPKYDGVSSIVPAMSANSIFGHQGFTGTVVWCDPHHELVYVFLSNRVFPDCYPNKLSQSQIRLKAHDLIYKDVIKK